MPTLEQIRKWARGERVKGLPKPERRKTVPKPALEPTPDDRHYRINSDGDDALLLFGTFRGERVSDMVRAPRKKRYLNWMLRQDFPADLKSVVAYRLEIRKKPK